MAVAAFGESLAFTLPTRARPVLAMRRNFRACRWAEDLAPHFLRRLHLAGDLVGPVVRHVAVRALARTPERLVKWIVALISSETLSRISWQVVQNCSVLVASTAVLKPPQKTTPRDKAAERQEAEAEIGVGETTTDPVAPGGRQACRSAPSSCGLPAGSTSRPTSVKRVLDQRPRVRLRHVAQQCRRSAAATSRRKLPSRSMKMRDADHGGLGLLVSVREWQDRHLLALRSSCVAVDRVRDGGGCIGKRARGARRR